MNALPASMRFVDHGSGGGPEVLAVRTMPLPRPGAGEVLIEVSHAGVNRPDCAQRIGRYPPPPGASPLLGLEVAGRVVALGDGATRWKLGDKVCALTPGGGYAEFCVAPEGHCLPVPRAFTLAQAAALPETFFTVWDNVFRRARLQPSEVLLVHGGSGGVGSAAIQMAKACGATAIATAGSADKAGRCMRIGADLAIDYRQEDFVERVLAHTQGRGADVILDMVAGPYLARDLQALALDGRIAVIAFMGGTQASIDVVPLLRKRAQITGSTLRPCTREHKALIAGELQASIWPHLELGLCKPPIEAVFALEDAARAHELMESGGHFGKILLEVNGRVE